MTPETPTPGPSNAIAPEKMTNEELAAEYQRRSDGAYLNATRDGDERWALVSKLHQQVSDRLRAHAAQLQAARRQSDELAQALEAVVAANTCNAANAIDEAHDGAINAIAAYRDAEPADIAREGPSAEEMLDWLDAGIELKRMRYKGVMRFWTGSGEQDFATARDAITAAMSAGKEGAK